MKRLFVILVVLSALIGACGGGQPAQDVDAVVQATFQALTAQAPQATPSAATGSI